MKTTTTENPFLYPNKPVLFHRLETLEAHIDLSKYLVQPKYNGDRAIVSCSKDGKVVVFSRLRRELNGTKGKFDYLADAVKLPKPWVLDGEWVKEKFGIYWWDVGMVGGKFVGGTPYKERFEKYEELVGRIQMPADHKMPFLCRTIWAECDSKHYQAVKDISIQGVSSLEGLVYKLKDATDLWGVSSTSERPSQLKWRK
jgi:hypothetical protein